MKRTAAIALLLCTPLFAHAQVLITEIMYAPEGTDADHEWIEVCNTGASTVTIDAWKFFENDTNHKLSLVSGTPSLSSGTCAVIADDATVFSGDYPNFSGTLFDSTFSLKNTGETIALKNENGDEVDSVTYSDADGAKDDGLSLHRSGVVLTPAAPTPGTEEIGVQQGGTQSGGGAGDTPQSSPVTLYSYESVTIEPPQDVYVRVPTEVTATAHAPTTFTMEAYNATGQAVDGGRVRWSFGDGGSADGRTVTHQFVYPGEYLTTVTFTLDTLSDTQRIRVRVVPLEAKLHVAPDGAWVELVNEGTTPLDVSNWRIVSSGQYFRIPEGTLIPAGTAVRFASEITKLSLMAVVGTAQLVYPDGNIALRSTPRTAESEMDMPTAPDEKTATGTATSTGVRPDTDAAPQSQYPTAPTTPVAAAHIPDPPPVLPVHNARATDSTSAGSSTDATATTQTATVILAADADTAPTNTTAIYWYFGLAALLTCVVSVVVLGRPRARIVDGFEVIEVKDEE